MKKDPDAHRNIEKGSKTWAQVKKACEAGIATASRILDDPAQAMVDIRTAQGDKRAYKAILALAEPPKKREDTAVPEDYPSGGHED